MTQPDIKNIPHEIGRLRNMTPDQERQYWKDICSEMNRNQIKYINQSMNSFDRPEPSPSGQKKKLEFINSLSGPEQRYALGWYVFQ